MLGRREQALVLAIRQGMQQAATLQRAPMLHTESWQKLYL